MTTFFIVFGIYLACVLLCTSVTFLIATAINDNGIMDIVYGPSFIVATVTTIFLTESFTLLTTLATVLVCLWGARLSIRILRKNIGNPEDARYAAWRKAWTARSSGYFILRSYLQIYLLQGIIISLVSLPIITLIAFPNIAFGYFAIIGSLVWLIGFVIETTADWQLDAFIARKKAGTEPAILMTKGLFRYSRRPNYFGESLIWWGFWIIALTAPIGIVAILSPIIITYIVTSITGPMLERIFTEKYGDVFKEYQATTNYFIPGLPKQPRVATDS